MIKKILKKIELLLKIKKIIKNKKIINLVYTILY